MNGTGEKKTRTFLYAAVFSVIVALSPLVPALGHTVSSPMMPPPPPIVQSPPPKAATNQPIPTVAPTTAVTKKADPKSAEDAKPKAPATDPAFAEGGGLTFKEVSRDAYMSGVVVRDTSRFGPGVAHAATDVPTYLVEIVRSSEKVPAEPVTAVSSSTDTTRYVAGDRVTLMRATATDGGSVYVITGFDRLRTLLYLTLLFFVTVVVFGGIRAVTSTIGLASTVGIILGYVVPQIVHGTDPFAVCLVAAFAIATSSLFLAHGFNRRTTIAFIGTTITLCVSAGATLLASQWARLSGTSGGDIALLQNGPFAHVDFYGLLLGGIILGSLGMLDDVTTAQAAIVEELKHANPSLHFRELYRRGNSVGREHIASLINTLFLAYAGASMPLFLLLSTGTSQPLWYVISSESIVTEIVRTIIGSGCLVLAVPLTTALAAAYYDKRVVDPNAAMPDGHHHHRH